MHNNLKEFIQDLQNKKDFPDSEEATKQGIILPILSFLKWNIFNTNEVFPEYSVESNRVDYVLRDTKGENKVFIEVKNCRIDLNVHQEQLLNYSFKQGVKLAVLTNGLSWWFYLPLKEGDWEQRKFYTIEITEQQADEICQNFELYLQKEEVLSDKAYKNAESVFEGKQKQNKIENTLPKAWNKIWEEQNEELVNLISSTTAKLCGFTPDDETVKKFIKTHDLTIKDIKIDLPSRVGKSNLHVNKNYTYKKISFFKFKQIEYEVNSWSKFLISICNILYQNHPKDFQKVLNLKGRQRPYFSKSSSKIRKPSIIRGSGIYVETNLSANSIMKLVMELIKLFGYKEKDLEIHCF
ncbi:MAG: type I restriction enzyme HsdR N-terminal domain-containing protein [Ignavibacteria bacterium]|nr:type I restriction enzyme HsdR N-terminal domain-containing protein [Ignavibacteria bacterium]